MHFFSLVLKNLLRRPARSLLTIAGLSVAVASMVALVGVATGFERSFLEYYTQRGVDFVVQRSGSGTEALNDGLPQQLGARIAAVNGVKQVDGRLVDAISFEKYGIIGVIINGWLFDSPLFDRLTVREGCRLLPGEIRVAMLGRVLAANLGKQIGNDVEIYGQSFKVVGIYESPTVFENGGVVVPLADLQREMNRPNEVTGFSVVAQHPASDTELGVVQKRIEQVQPNLKVTRVDDFVHNLTQIRLCRATAWATSAVALVLGVIGILNTMVMSVYERVNEIGLLRAIGWRSTRIVRMVMGESMLLSCAAAIVGTCIGLTLVKFLSRLPISAGLVSGDVGLSVIGQAFLLALCIGLIGSVYPALWSARLLPTEALRHK